MLTSNMHILKIHLLTYRRGTGRRRGAARTGRTPRYLTTYHTIYVYIHIHVWINLSLSLSMCVYIYIYIHNNATTINTLSTILTKDGTHCEIGDSGGPGQECDHELGCSGQIYTDIHVCVCIYIYIYIYILSCTYIYIYIYI